MGGGGEPFVIPDYKIYNNWRTKPQLVEHEARLAKMGLKDPWIRNVAFLYEKGMPHHRGGPYQNSWWFIKNIAARGIYAGLGIAAGLIVIDEAWMMYRKGHISWIKPAGGH